MLPFPRPPPAVSFSAIIKATYNMSTVVGTGMCRWHSPELLLMHLGQTVVIAMSWLKRLDFLKAVRKVFILDEERLGYLVLLFSRFIFFTMRGEVCPLVYLFQTPPFSKRQVERA